MMREIKTLKGLFPERKRTGQKNFIKENVKSVHRMDQLFQRQRKISGKHNIIRDNHETINSNEGLQELQPEEVIENGIAKLLNQKSFHEDQNRGKKSAPVLINKKVTSKKLSRPTVNGNLIKGSHGYKDQIERKSKNRPKLKAHSDGDVAHENVNDDFIVNKTSTKCKNQGVQTIDTQDINNIYLEGVIRYPSGRKETQKTKPSIGGDAAPVSECDESDAKNTDRSLNDSPNFTKGSKDRISLANKLAAQLNNGAPPSSYRMGVVPKYIKERKEAIQKEQQAKVSSKHSDCPSGHVPLPDNERKETLSILKKNYSEYVNELNMLPIRTDTLRSQKRKMEIEKQLTKLEEAIKVFSRPKVFVKIDA